MLKHAAIVLATMSITSVVIAQNVKSEDVEFRHIKLPLSPLPASIKNYQSFIYASYEAENQKKREQYENELNRIEAEYQREMQEYPARVKEAEDRYAAELAEYNKKSMAEKVLEKQLLNENNKPVKRLPSTPYRRSVSQPQLKNSYDYPALASTYIQLDGYSNSDQDAVRIEVTLNGYEFTEPRQTTEIKKITTYTKGVSSTRDVPYYSTEFNYRHTMSVKVTNPNGTEIMYVSPKELNDYKTFKTPQSTTSSGVNRDQLLKTYEEKILQENLVFLNELVNDKLGFKRTPRKSAISYVKSRDDLYSDIFVAYNEAVSGLKLLIDDQESATAKLTKSVDYWNAALQESDMENKKARIDKEVTTMLYFNLLEVYFVLGKDAEMGKIIDALNLISLSKSDRRQKEAYEVEYMDLKKRVQANKA